MIRILALFLLSAIVFGEKRRPIETRDSFYDKNFDYRFFTARVTDRDNTSKIIKIKTETSNVKFLKIGDLVEFAVGVDFDEEDDYCRSFVRDTQKNYIILYVQDIDACWKGDSRFRRGTMISAHSKILASRIKDASVYRQILMNRKTDYFHQLNRVNHFIWTYEEERVKVASKYDRMVSDILDKRRKELDLLRSKREEQLLIQRELSKKIGLLSGDIRYYQLEKNDFRIDRWSHDHALGLPAQKLPQEFKNTKEQ